jgi:glycosyltransferase involved in cell wall biosynthesis
VKSVLESIPSDAFVVGLVAKNLDDPNKRLGVALNLIKGVSTGKNIRPVVLLLVGDTKVAKKIASAEIRHVGTLQSVVDRKFAYSRMDVLLSISEAETAPLVVDEALTCGTPVIVRDVGGSAESVLDGVTGFVCMSDDEIQRGLIHLINDSSLSSRMRLAAPQDDRHSINNVLRSYTQIYSELIERRGILEDN